MASRAGRWSGPLLGLLILADLAHRAIQVAAGPFSLHTDSLGYWRIGRVLAETGSLLAADPAGHRTPVYPALVAGSYWLLGDWGLEGVVLLQNLFGVATALLVADLCRRVTGERWAAVAGYGLSAAALGRIQYDQQLMTESLFLLLLTLHLWLLLRALEMRSSGLGALSGLALGFSALTRPVSALLGAVEVLVLIATSRELGRRARVAPLVAMLAGCALPIGAWMARNAVVFDTPSISLVTRVNTWEHHFRPRGAALELPAEARARLPVGLDWRNGFSVRGHLLASGESDAAAAEWMASVAKSAREAEGLAYWRALARRYPLFWTTVEEAHPFYARCGPNVDGNFEGQRTWCAPRLVAPFAPLMRFWYRYPEALQVAVAVAALVASVALLLGRGGPGRWLGALTLGWMLYFSLVTVLVLFPLYRFRLALGPVFAVALVGGVARLLARRRDYDQVPSREADATNGNP